MSAPSEAEAFVEVSEATHEVRWPLMDGRCSRPGCDRTCTIPDVAESAPSEAEAFAEVLAAHATVATGLGEFACKCSPMEWRPSGLRASHLAAALLASPAMAERDARVKAEAWDEGVAVALDRSVRNDDGVTLRLDLPNPYRAGQQGRA